VRVAARSAATPSPFGFGPELGRLARELRVSQCRRRSPGAEAERTTPTRIQAGPLALGAPLLLAAAPASAAIITYDLNCEFSGADQPEGQFKAKFTAGEAAVELGVTRPQGRRLGRIARRLGEPQRVAHRLGIPGIRFEGGGEGAASRIRVSGPQHTT
jgi:hypothetical protein